MKGIFGDVELDVVTRNYREFGLSYFSPDSARSLPISGSQKHLNVHGDNLANVVQYMQREHDDRFIKVLDKISKKIPGIEKIDTKISPDGRLLLEFYAQGFADPFFAQQMSDGTLKFFTYMPVEVFCTLCGGRS